MTRIDANAPESWARWIKACLRSDNTPLELAQGSLGMVTGQDSRALHAITACWALYAAGDQDGQNAALTAAGALLGGMQEKCWPIAKELIAQQLDWSLRGRLWPQALARRAAKVVRWRGSVTDLVTDLASVLDPTQQLELAHAITRRLDPVRDMAELRAVPSAEDPNDTPEQLARAFFAGRIGDGHQGVDHPSYAAGSAAAAISLPELTKLLERARANCIHAPRQR